LPQPSTGVRTSQGTCGKLLADRRELTIALVLLAVPVGFAAVPPSSWRRMLGGEGSEPAVAEGAGSQRRDWRSSAWSVWRRKSRRRGEDTDR